MKARFFLILCAFLGGCDFSPKYLKLLKAAQEHVSVHEYDQAILAYEESAEVAPEEMKIKINYQLGRFYSTYQNNYEKAVAAFDYSSRLSDDPVIKARSLEELGEINFSFLRNYSEARKNYDQLIHFKPELSRIRFYEYRYALTYYHLKEWEKARALLKKISVDNDHEYFAQALYHLGRLEFENKNWSLAIDYMKSYIEKSKEQNEKINARFVMANSYENLNELIKAYNHYNSLLNDFPHPAIIKERMDAIYARRVAKKR
jgi:tetratricopeptide (TPR) repeat protein